MSRLAAIVAGAALFTGVAVDAQEDASLIVKRADLTRSPGDSFVWTVTITSTERDNAPAVNRYEVYVRGTASILVRFVSPPRDVEKLDAYERALGIIAGSPDSRELRRLAALGRGELPPAVLADRELVKKLPALFRTLEGDPIDDRRLEELAETIRRE